MPLRSRAGRSPAARPRGGFAGPGGHRRPARVPGDLPPSGCLLVDPAPRWATEARSLRGTAGGRPLRQPHLSGYGRAGSGAPAPGSCRVRETPRSCPWSRPCSSPRERHREVTPYRPSPRSLSLQDRLASGQPVAVEVHMRGWHCCPHTLAAACPAQAQLPAASAQPDPQTSGGMPTCVLGGDQPACNKLYPQPSCDSEAGKDALNSSKH